MSFFSALFGLDGMNRLQGEASQRAKQGYADASQYRNQFANQYLTGMGQAQSQLGGVNSQYGNMASQGNSIYGGLFNDYLKTIGYNGAYQLPQAGTQAQVNPYGSPNANRTPVQTTGAAGVLNRNRPAALPQGQAQAPQAANNPYALSTAQQAQSNQAVDRYAQAASNAIQEYRAQLAQRGLPPNAAGEAEIQANLARMNEETKANFGEQARQTRENGLNNLMGQGLQQQQQGVSGQMNVAQLLEAFASNPALLNLANSALGQANQDTNTQMQAMQSGNAFNTTLGTIGGLLGNNLVNWASGQLMPKKKKDTKA